METSEDAILPLLEAAPTSTQNSNQLPVCRMLRRRSREEGSAELTSTCYLQDAGGATSASRITRKLLLACGLTFAFMLVELVGGYIANSVAVMSDAAHMFSDTSSFAISALATILMNRRSCSKYSFGYHRAETVGALLSVLIIAVVTGGLVLEAVQRIINPVPVDGKIMFIVSVIGIVFNIILAATLGVEHHHGCGHSHSHSHGHAHGHAHSKRAPPAAANDDAHEHSHDDAHEHEHGPGGHEHAHGGQSGASSHSHAHVHGAEGCQHDHGDGHHDHDDHGAPEKPQQQPGALSCSHSHAHTHSSPKAHSHGGSKCGHSHGHSHADSSPAAAAACDGTIVVPIDLSDTHGHNHDHDDHDDHDHGHCHGGSKSKSSSAGACGAVAGSTLLAHDAHHHGRGGAHHGCSHGHGHGHGHSHGHSHDHENLNMRGAVVHVLGDLLQSIGVAIAGAVIWYTNGDKRWLIVDPLCTFMFAALVVWVTKDLVSDIIHVLMEGTPEAVSVEGIMTRLQTVEGVLNVHDLHIWSLATGKVMLTAHIDVMTGVEPGPVLHAAEEIFESAGVHHSTVQICAC